MGEVFWILLVAAAGPVIGSLAGVAFRPRPGAMGCMLAFAGGVMRCRVMLLCLNFGSWMAEK